MMYLNLYIPLGHQSKSGMFSGVTWQEYVQFPSGDRSFLSQWAGFFNPTYIQKW